MHEMHIITEFRKGSIAKQPGVAHILEGSVRKSGDRVRISAQLIAYLASELEFGNVLEDPGRKTGLSGYCITLDFWIYAFYSPYTRE